MKIAPDKGKLRCAALAACAIAAAVGLAACGSTVPGTAQAGTKPHVVTLTGSRPERIPSGARVLTVKLSHGLNPGERGHKATTTTDVAVIKAIEKRIDSLPKAGSGPRSCPADFGQDLTLTFRRSAHGAPIAVVVADTSGCEGVQVKKAGQSGPGLDGYGFAPFVEAEMGWSTTAQG